MKLTVPINENYQFRRLYRSGKNHVDAYIAVYYKKNRDKKNRLGITATKKIGCAVQRNRARRIIKEAYRLCEDTLPIGYDIVVVARKKAVYSGMWQIKKSLQKVFLADNFPSKG